MRGPAGGRHGLSRLRNRLESCADSFASFRYPRSTPMPHLQQKFGSLRATVVDALPAGREPQWLAVLCHGFGAPGTDLVPLADELFSLAPELRESWRFIFPEAPLGLDAQGVPGGRAWWELDMVRLMNAIECGEFRDVSHELPAGLPPARNALTEMLEAIYEQTGLSPKRTLLGGFSQGAMLTTDVALHLGEAPAALCILSGSLLCADVWKSQAAKRGPLRVLQSHGRQDPILPFEAAQWLRDALHEAGAEVEFVEFDGGHTISWDALTRLAHLAKDLQAGA